MIKNLPPGGRSPSPPPAAPPAPAPQPVAEAPGAADAAGSEKALLPKKRGERIVAGMDNVTVQLEVDIYRFAADTKEKAKP